MIVHANTHGIGKQPLITYVRGYIECERPDCYCLYCGVKSWRGCGRTDKTGSALIWVSTDLSSSIALALAEALWLTVLTD